MAKLFLKFSNIKDYRRDECTFERNRDYKSGIEFRTECIADLFREYKANSKTGNLSY